MYLRNDKVARTPPLPYLFFKASSLPDEAAQLRAISGVSVCVGFGISTAEQVRAVCSFADGAIVGSAIVRRIADALKKGMEEAALVDFVSKFLARLMAGVTPED